jgi:hypothetical protein
MDEPPDVAWPDPYPFAEPYGLVAHYTEAPIAFAWILPGKLRLSPYRLMRDPAENKKIEPDIRYSSDASRDKVYALLKRARDGMRVLSLTHDVEDRGVYYRTFDCCWARPRMWEQYGDKHRGACLLFDKTELERAICAQRPDERMRYFDNVVYGRDASVEVFRRKLDAEEILNGEDHARAIRDYIDANHDAFFFLKSNDFETEYEYRAVLTAGDDDRDEYTCIDYGDALKGVVLGERFPECHDPGAISGCKNVGVKLGWLAWPNGRPRVFPQRPRGLSG